MKYICAQPETLYYRWQIDVMIHSFLENGVSESDIIILSDTSTEEFSILKEKYPEVYEVAEKTGKTPPTGIQ